MENQYLFEEMRESPRPVKENKAQVIRELLSTGITVKEVFERTGYNRSYIISVKSGIPKYEKSKKIKKLKNMPVGFKFNYMGLEYEFMAYVKNPEGDTYVKFTNENDKQDVMPLSDLLESVK